MSSSFQDRLDPDGEMERLVTGLDAWSSGLIGALMRRLGLDEETMRRMQSAQAEYADLVRAPRMSRSSWKLVTAVPG